MNREILKKILEQNGISPELYNLNGVGRTDERFCIDWTDNQWHVFFSERGKRTTDEVFKTEEEACIFLYNQLIDK